jgi:DNA-damage-inducible protein J
MGMQNDVRVTVRVDKDLKRCADSLFERLGMNMTTAVNVFLRKAVDENAIPFPVSTKPAGFGTGLSADEITRGFSDTVAHETASRRSQSFPIARYDAARGRAFLENVDGTKEYIGDGC